MSWFLMSLCYVTASQGTRREDLQKQDWSYDGELLEQSHLKATPQRMLAAALDLCAMQHDAQATLFYG